MRVWLKMVCDPAPLVLSEMLLDIHITCIVKQLVLGDEVDIDGLNTKELLSIWVECE
jgi:hypothetical protein